MSCAHAQRYGYGEESCCCVVPTIPVFLFMQCQGKDNACTCICVPCDTGVQCVPGETTADLVLFFLIQGTKYIHWVISCARLTQRVHTLAYCGGTEQIFASICRCFYHGSEQRYNTAHNKLRPWPGLRGPARNVWVWFKWVIKSKSVDYCLYHFLLIVFSFICSSAPWHFEEQ